MLIKSKGFTLVEMLVVVMVSAIGLMIALPTFTSTMNDLSLRSTTERLISDLTYARSEAVKNKTTMYIDIDDSTNWCYGIDDDAGCDCSVADNCEINSVTKIIPSTNFTGTTITANGFTDDDFEFDGIRGMSDDSGSIVLSRDGRSVTVTVGLTGQISACSDSIGRYPDC